MGSRDIAIAVIKASFVTITKRALLAGLSSFGLLGANPFVQAIAGAFLDSVLTYLSNHSEMEIFFKFIDWRGAAQNKDWVAAAYANHAAQQNGTKQEKKDAEEALWVAARNFIKLTS